jgi:hypothetical protein
VIAKMLFLLSIPFLLTSCPGASNASDNNQFRE